MSTYGSLKADVLAMTGTTGQEEAIAIAELALYRCMRWVAKNIRVAGLIKEATATWSGDASLSNALTIGSGGDFNVSDFAGHDRLYVKSATSTEEYGTPYNFMEYHYLLDLLNSPRDSSRRDFTTMASDDVQRPVWTLTLAGDVWCLPVNDGDILTLVYRTEPAAYNDATTPEIDARFNDILLDGAAAVIREHLLERSYTPYDMIFDKAVGAQLKAYSMALESYRNRKVLRPHATYRDTRNLYKRR